MIHSVILAKAESPIIVIALLPLLFLYLPYRIGVAYTRRHYTDLVILIIMWLVLYQLLSHTLRS